MDPTLAEGMLDDCLFDVLDRHRRVVNTQNAGSFAGRRAYPSGEFGEVVRGVEGANGFLPAIAIDEVIPIRDDIVERAARVAEGHAAIHAARRLNAQLRLREFLVHFLEIIDALSDGPTHRAFACVLHESGHLTHAAPLGLTAEPGNEPGPGLRRRVERPALVCTRAG